MAWTQAPVERGRRRHGRLYGRHGAHESLLQSKITVPAHQR
ncbi:hypothetical protein AVEN_58383-1, partial [Araneus ventricosus]